MDYEVVLSPEFQNDLDDIWDYIGIENGNPEGAIRITEGILDAVSELASFPCRGRTVMLAGDLDSGYRYIVFEAYVIVYRIQRDIVQIARVVHHRQDYLRVLFPWMYKSTEAQDE